MPTISMITISYCAANHIGKTIESVLAQTYTDYEYIFVDGGSNDDTVAIIESYRQQFEARGVCYRVKSEPDKGIYDAMNKGVDRASGQWVLMLNAGDCLADERVLQDIFEEKTYDEEVLYGDTLQHSGAYLRFAQAQPAQLLTEYMPFCHQSAFVKAETLRRFRFDTAYAICADYDLFVRLYRSGAAFRQLSRTVSVYSMDGVSETRAAKVFSEYEMAKKASGIITGGGRQLAFLRYMASVWKQRMMRSWFPSRFYHPDRGWKRESE